MSQIQCISWRLRGVWRKQRILGVLTTYGQSFLENVIPHLKKKKVFYKERDIHKLLPKSFPKSVDPGPAVPASPGRLLEMQILELLPRSTKSGVLGVGHSNICFHSPPGDFNASHKQGATILGKLPVYKHIKLP